MTGGFGWAAMRKTGPNDTSCVVWAKGMCFFFLFHILLNLTNFFALLRCYSSLKTTGWVRLGCDEKNGPKRLFKVSVFFFFLLNLITFFWVT